MLLPVGLKTVAYTLKEGGYCSMDKIHLVHSSYSLTQQITQLISYQSFPLMAVMDQSYTKLITLSCETQEQVMNVDRAFLCHANCQPFLLTHKSKCYECRPGLPSVVRNANPFFRRTPDRELVID